MRKPVNGGWQLPVPPCVIDALTGHPEGISRRNTTWLVGYKACNAIMARGPHKSNLHALIGNIY